MFHALFCVKTLSETLVPPPLMTAGDGTRHDESTTTPGLFLVGPAVRHGELSFCFVYKSRRALALTVTIQVSKHTENRFIFAVNVLAVSFWLVRNSSLPILLCIRTCIFIRICSAKHTTRAVEVDEDVRQSVCVCVCGKILPFSLFCLSNRLPVSIFALLSIHRGRDRVQ